MTVMELAGQLTEHVIINFINKSKHKFVNIDAVSEYLKEKLGDEYTSETAVAVKNALKEHPQLTFFREGDYVHQEKFSYCVGNYIAVKGLYKNPIEAKDKLGWYSWQTEEEINWED